jgi:hypothetical protein
MPKKEEPPPNYITQNPIVNTVGAVVGIANRVQDKSLLFLILIFAFGWYFTPKFLDSMNNNTRVLSEISLTLKDIKEDIKESRKENLEQNDILKKHTFILERIQEIVEGENS